VFERFIEIFPHNQDEVARKSLKEYACFLWFSNRLPLRSGDPRTHSRPLWIF